MDKASQESGSVNSGLVIVCLRCWDFVSSHATVTNIHLFQIPHDVIPEDFRPPLSAALLFSAAVHLPGTSFWFVKTPKMTHTGTIREKVIQGCSQPSNFSLPISGPGEWPKDPLQLHLQSTAWASAHRKPKSLTLC